MRFLQICIIVQFAETRWMDDIRLVQTTWSAILFDFCLLDAYFDAPSDVSECIPDSSRSVEKYRCIIVPCCFSKKRQGFCLSWTLCHVLSIEKKLVFAIWKFALFWWRAHKASLHLSSISIRNFQSRSPPQMELVGKPTHTHVCWLDLGGAIFSRLHYIGRGDCLELFRRYRRSHIWIACQAWPISTTACSGYPH